MKVLHCNVRENETEYCPRFSEPGKNHFCDKTAFVEDALVHDFLPPPKFQTTIDLLILKTSDPLSTATGK